jgi:hypothetical protein
VSDSQRSKEWRARKEAEDPAYTGPGNVPWRESVPVHVTRR